MRVAILPISRYCAFSQAWQQRTSASLARRDHSSSTRETGWILCTLRMSAGLISLTPRCLTLPASTASCMELALSADRKVAERDCGWQEQHVLLRRWTRPRRSHLIKTLQHPDRQTGRQAKYSLLHWGCRHQPCGLSGKRCLCIGAQACAVLVSAPGYGQSSLPTTSPQDCTQACTAVNMTSGLSEAEQGLGASVRL